MIKILKEGKKHSQLFYKATCPFCQCEFIYDDVEVRLIGTSHRIVNCPCCYQHIAVYQYGFDTDGILQMEVWHGKI